MNLKHCVRQYALYGYELPRFVPELGLGTPHGILSLIFLCVRCLFVRVTTAFVYVSELCGSFC